MLRILHGAITQAVQKYDCRCVVIDCGAIVDPYTAAAVMLADRSFIIATNEEISFQNLRNYPRSIRDFYPDFKVAKMRTVFNKVRRHDLLEQRKLNRQQDVYASIPFQDAVMDGTEGVDSADKLARIFLRKHVGDVVERVFRGDHAELIPDPQSMVPPDWFPVLQNAGPLLHGPKMDRKRLAASFLLALGTVLLVLSVGFFGWASWDRHGAERLSNA
ncbi:MAG: ParA family protein, partial [bacterium]|nr:ParA family protein [bacterium]